MRILHIVNHFHPTVDGYVVRTMQLLRALLEQGHECAVAISPRGSNGLTKSACAGAADLQLAEYEGVLCVYSGRERRKFAGVLDELFVFSRVLASWTSKWRPDLIHVHTPSLWAISAHLARLGAVCPVVYEVRGVWEEGAVDLGKTRRWTPRYRAAYWLETKVAQLADVLCVISSALKDEFVRRGIPPSKVVVVPNGIGNAAQVSMARASEFVPSDHREPYRVLYLGSLYAWEGVDNLIHAMKLLVDRPYIAHIVGDGPERSNLTELARALGVQNRVLFEGRVAPTAATAWYDIADVVVYPRRKSRQTELVTPLKPLEAMAFGKPVVVSDVRGLRELCPPGTAVTFTPGRPDELARAIREVCENDSLRASLASRARSYVWTHRTWDVVCRGYADAYRRAIANARRRGVRVGCTDR